MPHRDFVQYQGRGGNPFLQEQSRGAWIQQIPSISLRCADESNYAVLPAKVPSGVHHYRVHRLLPPARAAFEIPQKSAWSSFPKSCCLQINTYIINPLSVQKQTKSYPHPF